MDEKIENLMMHLLLFTSPDMGGLNVSIVSLTNSKFIAAGSFICLIWLW